MEIMTPQQIIFPDKNEIIYELKSQAIQFLKNYHLEIKGVAIYPKEIEVYFYQSGVFEDDTVHCNELQKDNANHLYVHRTGLKKTSSYKGGNRVCADFVVSNDKSKYYSYLLRSVVIDNKLTVGPNKTLCALKNALGIESNEILEKQVVKVVKHTPSKDDIILTSERINLGRNGSYTDAPLRFVVCDDFFRKATYPLREKLLVSYMIEMLRSAKMEIDDALCFIKYRLGYLSSALADSFTSEEREKLWRRQWIEWRHDRYTNFVYISDKLKEFYPDTHKRLTALFNDMGIDWGEIPYTEDIWVRDFMPIQIDNKFLLYKYYPDYLDNDKDRRYITDAHKACDALGIKYREVKHVLDGGNISFCGHYVVLTDKALSEGSPSSIKSEVFNDIFTPIFIPWEKTEGDPYGHSDGIIHWCGGKRVLMSNYRNTNSSGADYIKEKLEQKGFVVTELLFDEVKSQSPDWNWAYINYLQVGNKIIMPSFGIPEDKIALKYIQEANPGCEIRQIRLRDIAGNGGALHCITWNIRKKI